MTLNPLMNAPLEIQLHVAFAVAAILLGPFALYRRRRDRLHKIMGYSWITSMAGIVVTSFFITSFGVIGPFSPIHAFSFLTTWSLYNGMRHVLAGRYRAHGEEMRSLYWRGLWLAGLFNFIPGRTVNRMVFGEASDLGWVVIALGVLALIWHWWRGRTGNFAAA